MATLCLRILAGMESFVDDFLAFRYYILMFGKNSHIFVILTWVQVFQVLRFIAVSSSFQMFLGLTF